MIRFVPAVMVETLSCDELFDRGTMLRVAPPIMKVMLPVGVVVVEMGWTFAINVTAWPYVDGLLLDETDTVTDPGLTVSGIGVEVLLEKLVSPPYWAVMAWVPTESVETVNCAELLDTLAKPKGVMLSRKITAPVAVLPAPG